jgi:HSP20 family protein
MSSFLDRLKKKDIVPSTPEDGKKEKIAAQNKPPETAGPPAEQLKVDICQTHNAIIIYAQIAGATVHDYGVHIEGDGDVVTIKGERKRPEDDHFQHDGLAEKENILSECSWGKFYRQIILPAEVDPTKTQAKTKDGVLMLLLPLRETADRGVRIDVVQV